MSSIYEKMTDPEREVADYLQNRDLWWVYEFPVFVYDEKKRPRVWTPDFYIPKLGLYIEVCGSKEFDYEYRKEISERMEFLLCFYITIKDAENGSLSWQRELWKSSSKGNLKLRS